MLDDLFKLNCSKIGIVTAKETIDDPIEKNVTYTEYPAIPIKAIIADVGFSSINWKMPGIVTDKVKEIMIESRHLPLLKLSYKIIIDSENYEGWRINGKLQYRQEGSYIRAYVYIKKV